MTNNPLVGLGTALDFELDFDLGDFDLNLDGEEQQERVLKPRIDPAQISRNVIFENAQAFADQIVLEPGSRTYAWINGNFIFGDVIEALLARRGVGIKNLYIASLGISRENVDSFRTLLELPCVERMEILLSGYFYSHEKHDIVPYLFEQLDYQDKFQVAFGNYHSKIICIETHKGNTIVIHGSANLRSSNSIEQIMVEVGADDLFAFNRDIIHATCEKFGCVNKKVKRLGGAKSWQAAVEVAAASAPAEAML